MALLQGGKDTPISKQLTVICTNMTQLNIISSFTFIDSIASNKRKCTKKWTNGLIARWKRHIRIKTTGDVNSTNLTHLNIMSLITFIVSIASNKRKCTKKWTNGLIAGWERHTHSKTTDNSDTLEYHIVVHIQSLNSQQ